MTIAAAANLNFFSLLNAALLNIVVDTGSARMPTNVGCRSVRSSDVFLCDVRRVYPGPGRTGLQLLQIGVSMSVNEINEPHVVIPTWPRYGHIQCFAPFGDCSTIDISGFHMF